MKKFSIPCDFNGTKAPFTIYIGSPKADHHPIQFQANWLSTVRQGTVPPEVMDSLSKLRDLADKNGVPFEDLCVYAIGAAQEVKAEEEDSDAADTEDAPQILDDGDGADGSDSDAADSGDSGDGSGGGGSGDVDLVGAGDDSDVSQDDDGNPKKK